MRAKSRDFKVRSKIGITLAGSDLAGIPLEREWKGPFDLVFPEAAVIDLGKLVVFLANCLAQVGLGVLLEPPNEDQLFVLELAAGDVHHDCGKISRRDLPGSTVKV
jgi:hypothetical protein